MAPVRIHRARRASTLRNVRGSGWHKKGYRSIGAMWINVNEGTYTRGRDVLESEKLASFARELDELPDERQDGMWVDVFFRKKSIFDLAEENPDDLVEDWFDGGETVYRKYYDSEGYELKYTGWGYEATAKQAHRLRSPPCGPHTAQGQAALRRRLQQEHAAATAASGPSRNPAAAASSSSSGSRGGMSLLDCIRGAEQERTRIVRMTPAQRRAYDEEEDDRLRGMAEYIMEQHQLQHRAQAEGRARPDLGPGPEQYRRQFARLQRGRDALEAEQRHQGVVAANDAMAASVVQNASRPSHAAPLPPPRTQSGMTRAQLHQLQRQHMQRQQARAVGRTPEEVEELEAALEARRRRRHLGA